MFSRVAVDISN